nr:beta-fructofuranosidase (EC 3.2.1.26) isozyme I, soluble - carrot (fragments) [Daucus carota]
DPTTAWIGPDGKLLWGWIGESDNEPTDVLKGWASVQSIPR